MGRRDETVQVRIPRWLVEWASATAERTLSKEARHVPSDWWGGRALSRSQFIAEAVIAECKARDPGLSLCPEKAPQDGAGRPYRMEPGDPPFGCRSSVSKLGACVLK